MRTFVTTLALFTTLATAQNLTAHPQETLQNGNGNVAALGVISGGLFAEGRAHILVPKDELPSFPAALLGIEFHGGATDTVHYGPLVITLAPTTATQLSPVFANNFTAPATTVFNVPAVSVPWTTAGWVRLNFAQPYVHDGSSALLIEIQKVVQPDPVTGYPFMTITTSSSPSRTDRPAMCYAFSGPSGGGSTATQATTFAVSHAHRLVWQFTPTLRHLSDVGGSGNQYNLGGSVTFTVAGNAGELWVLAASLGFLPASVPIPGFGGALRVGSPVVFASGVLGVNGEGTHVLALPANPSLIGFYLAYQAATVDAGSGAIVLTNGTDHFING